MDGYEPHDTIYLAGVPAWSMSVPASAVGGVYPGWGMRVGTGRAIPGTQQDPPRTPY